MFLSLSKQEPSLIEPAAVSFRTVAPQHSIVVDWEIENYKEVLEKVEFVDSLPFVFLQMPGCHFRLSGCNPRAGRMFTIQAHSGAFYDVKDADYSLQFHVAFNNRELSSKVFPVKTIQSEEDKCDLKIEAMYELAGMGKDPKDLSLKLRLCAIYPPVTTIRRVMHHDPVAQGEEENKFDQQISMIRLKEPLCNLLDELHDLRTAKHIPYDIKLIPRKDLFEKKEHLVSAGAHKVVLAARSPVFRESILKNRFDGEVSIGGDVLPLFLDFLYTGEINLAGCHTDFIMSIIFVADQFKVGALKDYCFRKLATMLTPENLLDVLTHTGSLYLESHLSVFHDYINTNAKELHGLTNSEDFKKFPDRIKSFFIDACLNPSKTQGQKRLRRQEDNVVMRSTKQKRDRDVTM